MYNHYIIGAIVIESLIHFANYTTNSQSTSSADPAEVAAILAIVLPVLFVVVLLSYIITAIFLGSIFKKAGVATWKAWVPVYNNWTTYELGGQKGFWALLMFVPVINLVSSVFLYISYYHIGKKLSKPGEFVLLAIFLPIVWLIWLAVDKSTWEGAMHSDSRTPRNEPPTFTPPTLPTGA